MDVGPTELIIVLVVILVLFGGAKLPELARSLGKAKKEFHDGLNEGVDGHESAAHPTASQLPAPPASTPPARPSEAEPVVPSEATEGPAV